MVQCCSRMSHTMLRIPSTALRHLKPLLICSSSAPSWTPAGQAHARTSIAPYTKRLVHVKSTLLPPSPEQQVAIDTLLHTQKNVIVDACAGSGKTTTILHLAQSAPKTKFLVLMYNQQLTEETKQKVQNLGLDNLFVQNYNTLGVRCYTSEASTDQGLKRIVEDDMPVLDGIELPEFSVLVLDELQDITPISKRFVDKVICDKGFVGPDRQSKAGKQLRIFALGDRRQELYGFNNADSRFLSMAGHAEVFGYINRQDWVLAHQMTSNRITKPNVDFINQQLLKDPEEKPMRAVKTRDASGWTYPQPRYVICDPYNDMVSEVLRLLKMQGLSPNDIIVLTPSVRGRSPVISLANELALREIPVFRSDSDISEIAPEVAHGKVLICTYHQAKGIERKASIVLGFDQGYHNFYNRVSEDPIAVTNPQYVAVTRALEHLVLIHEHTNPPLPFVNLDTVEQTCHLVMTRKLNIQPSAPESPTSRFNVVALCRNVPETLATDCLSRLKFLMIAEPTYGSSPPSSEIRDRYDLLEGVADITGTAVPAVYEWYQRKKLTILSGARELLSPLKRRSKKRDPLRELPDAFCEKIRKIIRSVLVRYDTGSLDGDDILFLSNLKIAEENKDITKLLSIPPERYIWLKEPYCRNLHYILNTLPGAAKIPGRGISFEFRKSREFLEVTHGGGPTRPEKKAGITVSGIMDICYHPKGKKCTVWGGQTFRFPFTRTPATSRLIHATSW